MTDEEKDFIKNVNIDKAKIKNTSCIILIIISILSYVFPLLFGDFDFGLIFELISLAFMVIAHVNMKKYDESRSEIFTILSIIPIGWLLIYDLLTIIPYITSVLDFSLISYDFILQETFSFLILILSYRINKDLRKADNPEKYKESTDWFYEKLDGNDRNK